MADTMSLKPGRAVNPEVWLTAVEWADLAVVLDKACGAYGIRPLAEALELGGYGAADAAARFVLRTRSMRHRPQRASAERLVTALNRVDREGLVWHVIGPKLRQCRVCSGWIYPSTGVTRSGVCIHCAPETFGCGTYASYNRGCRCDACRQKNSEVQLRLRVKRSDKPAPRHGRSSSYTNWGCRCDLCRVAHAEVLRKQLNARRKRLKADATVVEHGRMATYQGWGCRCDACVEAMRLYWRERDNRTVSA